jgi:hypothetical protein
MPTLEKTLPKDDLGYLKIVAAFWGVELTTSAPAQAAQELAAALCDAELLEEVVSTLPDEAQTSLGALADSGGRIPWEAFTRQFGELREIGPGKRDREKPHLRPVSTTETLWYRALLARAFFETERGPQEFAFIPDDLLEALAFIGFKSEEPPQQPTQKKTQPVPIPEDKPLGRPATPTEKAHSQTASDGILEEITTLLAAIRTNRPLPALNLHQPFALDLLTACRILNRPNAESEPAPQAGNLNPELLKRFFESTRAEALSLLTEAWRGNPDIDELRQHPDLLCEGGWRNNPLRTRTFLLDLLSLIPKNQWWSLAALLRDLKTASPDFQRSGGEYDTWFIKRRADSLYLRGFEHWDEVEGALLRYLVQILHWLGLADVASAQENGPLTAFRLLAQAESREENGKITVTSNGRISALRLTPRSVRYQVARFCEWEEQKTGSDYRYRVTPDSLKAAHAQGLKAGQLLSLLAKNASAPIPPPFVKALQRWEVNGTEARIEHPVILKVSRPEVMSELKNSKAGRFLSEPLGPTAAVVKPGAESKILEALSEMGLLTETGKLKEE